MNEPLLTVDEVAVVIRRNRRWVAEQARLHAIPCTRIGRKVLFTTEHVRRIIAAGEQEPDVSTPRIDEGMTARSIARQRAS